MERTDETIRKESIRLYKEEEMTAPQIAKQVGTSASCVYRWLREDGVQAADFKRRGQRGGRYKLKLADKAEEIIKRYEAGEGSEKIGKDYQVSALTVRHLLLVHGVEIRRRGGEKKQFDPELVAEVARRWLAGEAQTTIGEDVGLSQSQVSALLAAQGITKYNRRPRRERHGMWNGGRIKVGGYAYVRLEPGSPFMAMAQATGYVAEHRLIMAQSLGRPLRATETVHHINDIKDDNRIENLQLRQGKHGKGAVLVCADCGSHDLVYQELA